MLPFIQAAGLWWVTFATASGSATAPNSDAFGDYWYQGQAEISSYALQQARYGEIHEGEAVLIFVTEAHDPETQIKLDREAPDQVTVLKLNMMRKFLTGLYPYSMMSSVFTPVHEPRPMPTKISTSVQEWCGHTYQQLNRTEDGYAMLLRSYFESEGDQTLELEATLLEDGLWNTIRLNPDALPLGSLQMVPGTMFQRLRHVEAGPFPAQAQWVEAGAGRRGYQVHYPRLGRTLTIEFDVAFPHVIQSFSETAAGGLTTTATRLVTKQIAYWQHHSVADQALRQEWRLK